MSDAPENMDDIHPLAKPFMFLANPKVVRGFIYLPLIGMIVMIGLGFIFPMDEKHQAPWDFFGSWALIGFVAYSFVVLSAKPLFAMLSRPEDYYGEGGLPDPDVSTEGSHHHD